MQAGADGSGARRRVQGLALGRKALGASARMALQKDFLSARIALADGDAGSKKPPTEFQVFKAGAFETTKGLFLCDADSIASILKCAADYGNELCLDYNHGMADGWPVDPALSGKAAGWFALEDRGAGESGGLWAVNVRWTPAAAAAIAAGEWRYTSPWFSYDGETRRIHELHNVALTNTPATKNLKPLTASRRGDTLTESTNMNPKLLAALGLSATATEQDVLNALSAREAQLTAFSAQKAQVDEVLALTGSTTMSAALGTAKAWKASHEALPAVQEKLGKLEAGAVESELKTLLDAACTAGKVTPASRPEMEKLGKKDMEQLKALLNVMQPVVTTPGGAAKPKDGVVDTAGLSAEELAVARVTGLSAQEFAEAKAKQKASA
jgi:phage I-like protein